MQTTKDENKSRGQGVYYKGWGALIILESNSGLDALLFGTISPDPCFVYKLDPYPQAKLRQFWPQQGLQCWEGHYVQRSQVSTCLSLRDSGDLGIQIRALHILVMWPIIYKLSLYPVEMLFLLHRLFSLEISLGQFYSLLVLKVSLGRIGGVGPECIVLPSRGPVVCVPIHSAFVWSSRFLLPNSVLSFFLPWLITTQRCIIFFKSFYLNTVIYKGFP